MKSADSFTKKMRMILESQAKLLIKYTVYMSLDVLLFLGAKSLVFKLSEMIIERLPSEVKAGEFWLKSRDAINGTTILSDINRDLQTRFCSRPFEWLELGTEHAFLCCSAWLPTPIGTKDNPKAVWSSKSAKKIRQSILDKSFRYCSRLYCPYIVKGTLPADSGVVTKAYDTPRIFNLCYDETCNLSCPSCRTRMIVAKAPDRIDLEAYYYAKIAPLLQPGCVVNVTGSGDPFASKHFRTVLQDLTSREGVKIDLQTNGNLLDCRAWNELSLAGHVRRIRVSLDAATETTYNYVRRGGRLPRVLENIKFLVELRRAEEIEFVGIDIVMQSRNIEEVPKMVALAKELGVDKLRFNTIRNWGVYSAQEFKNESLHSDETGNKRRFEAMYAGGIFSDPIVDEGNIRQVLGYPYISNLDDDYDVGHT